LADLEQLVSWAQLEAQVVPFYSDTTGKRGHPAIGLSRLLRMYIVQQYFGFSDEGTEDAIYDSQTIRSLIGLFGLAFRGAGLAAAEVVLVLREHPLVTMSGDTDFILTPAFDLILIGNNRLQQSPVSRMSRRGSSHVSQLALKSYAHPEDTASAAKCAPQA